MELNYKVGMYRRSKQTGAEERWMHSKGTLTEQERFRLRLGYTRGNLHGINQLGDVKFINIRSIHMTEISITKIQD